MNINNNFCNSNYNNNSVAFQAKLSFNDEVGLLDKYADRFPKIIEGFEAKTAKNSKSGDVLEVEVSPNMQERLCAWAGLDGYETIEQADLAKGALKKLFRKNDNAIVNHLVKFFQVAQKNEDIWQSTQRFQKTMENKVRNTGFTDDADLLHEYAFQAQDAVRENLRNNEKFFAKNIDFWS